MKKLLYFSLITIFAIFACKKSVKSEISQRDLKNYLKIVLSNEADLYIGEMISVNESPTEDFKIQKRKDTIFVSQTFLESDTYDDKEIFVSDVVEKITLKYNIALHFNGTDKANIFIPLNFHLVLPITNGSRTPSLQQIKKNNELYSFLVNNDDKIKQAAYEYYLRYFESIPKAELESCCTDDFENYKRLKGISAVSIRSLDINRDLGISVDYSSLTINIESRFLQKVIVLTKENQPDDSVSSYENVSNGQSINENKNIDWRGEYLISAPALSLYNNEKIDLLYIITIDDDERGILSIGADQVQDYYCEGEYKLSKEDKVIHARGKCDRDDMDDFYLKHENGAYYIKSKRFLDTDWQILKKK